jgi:hypothetical protein
MLVVALGIGDAAAGCDAGGDTIEDSASASTAAVGGAGGQGGATTNVGAGGPGGGLVGSGGSTGDCQTPATPAGSNVVLAPEYAESYQAFELGAVPGVPDPLGGTTILFSDDDTLLIAGASEGPQGRIYAIQVERGPCGHILGFVGGPTEIAQTPYVDANLAYGPGNLLFYTRWPQFTINQLPAGATSSARETDLLALGMSSSGDQGPGGIAFVPPPLGAAGELRVVTWPAGHWYHVDLQADGALFTIPSISSPVQLDNNPGGFAYVPAGSPGFPVQSVIVAEWRTTGQAGDRVATYEVDDDGDPIKATRKEFFTSFPRPWGAYFEPLTGDYLFLTWGATPPDRVFIVQGFAPPPPPPQ